MGLEPVRSVGVAGCSFSHAGAPGATGFPGAGPAGWTGAAHEAGAGR